MGFGNRSTGRDTFGGEFGARHCNQYGLTFAATRPSSQITSGRLVIIIIIIVVVVVVVVVDKIRYDDRRYLLTISTPAVPNCCCSEGSVPY